MKKILITTGGTGGHVIPAKVIEENLRNNFEVYFSTDLRGKKYLSHVSNKIFIIDTPKLNISIYLPFRLIKLLFLIFRTFFFLKREKIDKVMSTGGYMSLPVIIAAKFLSLTIFLLEPNLVLGRGNRFFLNFSKKIICYSDKLYRFPIKYIDKIELVNPLVSKIFYETKKKETNDKFCILIFGGSQGAEIFDELVKNVLIKISKQFPIKIIQQTKKENVDKLKNFYNENNIDNKIFNYEEKLIDLINMADLCISRAGASSLAEISIMNKPFIAIPLPTAKDNHQMKNAEFYEQMGCCWVLEQNQSINEKLLILILDIISKKSDFTDKKLNLKKLNYKNSWKNVNQKIIKIFNEN